jgi:hypothetical protein
VGREARPSQSGVLSAIETLNVRKNPFLEVNPFSVHEGIERITCDLLRVERSEPGRLLAARRQMSEGRKGGAVQRIGKTEAHFKASARA